MRARMLIDDYLAAIALYLPAEKRADVRAELHGLFEDEILAAVASGADPDAAAERLIARFGAPEQVAARYGSGRLPKTPFQRAFVRLAILLIAVQVIAFGLRLVTIADQRVDPSSLISAGVQLVANILISLGVLVIAARGAAWLQTRFRGQAHGPTATQIYASVYGRTSHASRSATLVALALLTIGLTMLVLAPSPAAKILAIAASGGDPSRPAAAVLPYFPWLIGIALAWLTIAAVLAFGRPQHRPGTLWLAMGLKLITIAFFVHAAVAKPLSGDHLFAAPLKIVLLMGLTIAAGQVVVQMVELMRGGRRLVRLLPKLRASG